MWIRTQSKKDLVKVIRISIAERISIDNKVIIRGYYRPITLMFNNSVNLGIYGKEEAMEEMNRIHSFFIDNPNSIYEMSEFKEK